MHAHNMQVPARPPKRATNPFLDDEPVSRSSSVDAPSVPVNPFAVMPASRLSSFAVTLTVPAAHLSDQHPSDVTADHDYVNLPTRSNTATSHNMPRPSQQDVVPALVTHRTSQQDVTARHDYANVSKTSASSTRRASLTGPMRGTHIVAFEYKAKEADEIDLGVNDQVRASNRVSPVSICMVTWQVVVHNQGDDGWFTGLNLTTSKIGTFPGR